MINSHTTNYTRREGRWCVLALILAHCTHTIHVMSLWSITHSFLYLCLSDNSPIWPLFWVAPVILPIAHLSRPCSLLCFFCFSEIEPTETIIEDYLLKFSRYVKRNWNKLMSGAIVKSGPYSYTQSACWSEILINKHNFYVTRTLMENLSKS